MKKQGLKIRAALFLVTAALASSPVLTSVAAAYFASAIVDAYDWGGGSDEKGCKQRQG